LDNIILFIYYYYYLFIYFIIILLLLVVVREYRGTNDEEHGEEGVVLYLPTGEGTPRDGVLVVGRVVLLEEVLPRLGLGVDQLDLTSPNG
jgi:hypothetical protein